MATEILKRQASYELPAGFSVVLLRRAKKITSSRHTDIQLARLKPVFVQLSFFDQKIATGHLEALYIARLLDAYLTSRLDTQARYTSESGAPEGISAKVRTKKGGPALLELEIPSGRITIDKLTASVVGAALSQVLRACAWPIVNEDEEFFGCG